MVNGILNLYKPAGWTSNDAVCKLRGILHQKKVGHTGTLDPDAVGVLPICAGSATKVCDLLTDEDKEYTAIMRLGISTDTQDLSGQVISERPADCTFEEVSRTAASFVGQYDQIPPMYSARKINGKKLYEYAREGVVVDRKPKTVTIHSVSVQQYDPAVNMTPIGGDAFPEEASSLYVMLHVKCSKGTYIRTLIHDIGEKLGCGASMAALTRTRVGIFTLDNAFTLRQLQEMADEGTLNACITGADAMFPYAAACVPADAHAKSAVLNGNHVRADQLRCTESVHVNDQEFQGSSVAVSDDQIRIYDENGLFLALYRFDQNRHAFVPVKMFTTSTV